MVRKSKTNNNSSNFLDEMKNAVKEVTDIKMDEENESTDASKNIEEENIIEQNTEINSNIEESLNSETEPANIEENISQDEETQNSDDKGILDNKEDIDEKDVEEETTENDVEESFDEKLDEKTVKIDKEKEDKKVKNTYESMMGYLWNGQNYDLV